MLKLSYPMNFLEKWYYIRKGLTAFSICTGKGNKMYRFRIACRNERNFYITGEELHHLVKVLRLGPGDEIKGFDNSGREFLGRIESIAKQSVSCRILREDFPEVEAKARIYLVTGLSKGEKMEWVIQKGTELGMAGLVPLRTRRAVVRLEGRKAEERVARWQKIAAEAVKQSRRVIEPKIERVANWSDLVNLLPEKTQWLIPYESEKTQSLYNTLSSFDPKYPIAVLIGPEGGFEPGEVQWAQDNLGARSVSLGPRILRAETAALAVLTMILFHFGELG